MNLYKISENKPDTIIFGKASVAPETFLDTLQSKIEEAKINIDEKDQHALAVINLQLAAIALETNDKTDLAQMARELAKDENEPIKNLENAAVALTAIASNNKVLTTDQIASVNGLATSWKDSKDTVKLGFLSAILKALVGWAGYVPPEVKLSTAKKSVGDELAKFGFKAAEPKETSNANQINNQHN